MDPSIITPIGKITFNNRGRNTWTDELRSGTEPADSGAINMPTLASHAINPLATAQLTWIGIDTQPLEIMVETSIDRKVDSMNGVRH